MSEDISNALLEEYKTVRNTIFEADKRINSLMIYTVLSTATIIGFGIQSKSPLIFLLPVTIILPLGHKVRRIHHNILWNGTYILLNIESKSKYLNYETFLKTIRATREKKQKKTRGLFNYLLFDALAFVCVAGSFFSTVSLNYNIVNLFSNINIDSFFDYLYSNHFLIVLWIITTIFFIHLTMKMCNVYSAKHQRKFEEEIIEALNLENKNTK